MPDRFVRLAAFLLALGSLLLVLPYGPVLLVPTFIFALIALLGDRFKKAGVGPGGAYVEAFPAIRDGTVQEVVKASQDAAAKVAAGSGAAHNATVSPPTIQATVRVFGPTIEAAEAAMRAATTPEELGDRIVEYVQLALFSAQGGAGAPHG